MNSVPGTLARLLGIDRPEGKRIPLAPTLTDATGGILLLLKWPTGDALHMFLCELGNPTVIRLLAVLNRVRGVPTIHPPTLHLPAKRIPNAG